MIENINEIVYYSVGEPPIMSRSYTILDASDNEIGGVEGYINEEGEMHSVVKINPEFQKKGYGFKAFQRVFQELNSVIEIQKIVGNWLLDEEEFGYCDEAKSTNLKMFIDCVNSGLSEGECVFKTPTGKWAQELGFKNYEVKSMSNKTVTIHFY